MTRLHWIDHLKALGIVLVVLGHAAIPAPLEKWIFSFHMPLFFLAAGAVLAREAFEGAFKDFVRRRIARLFFAYLIFAAIGFAHFLTIKASIRAPQPHPVADKLLGILYASGTVRESPYSLHPIVLWFFPALMTGLALCYAIMRLPGAWRGPGCAAALGLGLLLARQPLPWELESGLCAAVLIYLGHVGVDRLARVPEMLRHPAAGLVFVAAGAAFSHWNSGFDFRTSTFGNPFFSALSFACTIFGLYALFRNVPRLALSERLSGATLVIFPLHTLGFWTVDSAAKRIFAPGIQQNLPYVFAKCCVVLGALTLVAPLFLRITGLARTRPAK